MPDVAVDRLHARYRNASVADADRLDRALAELELHALGAAVDGHLPTWVDGVHAVCVRNVTIELVVDPSAPVTVLADRWAESIGTALTGAVTSAADVVVLVTEVDALRALARAVITASTDRVWALHQLGLVPPSHPVATGHDLLVALAARPLLTPAVVGRAPGIARRWSASQWLDAAATFVTAATRGANGSEPRSTGGLPADLIARAVVALDRRSSSAAAARRDSVVPVVAYVAAAHDPIRATALAVLDLAITAPGSSGDPDVVAGVVVAALAEGGGPVPAIDRHVTMPDGSAVAPTAPDRSPPRSSETTDPVDDEAAPTPVETSWGGVLYLLHLLDGGAPEVLAHAVARMTGCPVDDPAARLVAGWPVDRALDELSATPDAEVAAAVDALVESIAIGLSARLPGTADDDPSDRTWIWKRRAALSVEPGWIEVEMDLADVDVGLRAAGLDLDPGYVWWLGAVVRFRHV